MRQRNLLLKDAVLKFKVEPDFPFKRYPEYTVLRHKESDHWFALFMNVPKSKLNLDGDGEIQVLDVKCRPEVIGSLRKRKGFLPAYHMNKELWITVLLDDSVEEATLLQLLEDSFQLTK